MGNIKTKNLVKEFGNEENKVRVLDNINIEIKDGEFVSLMGPSGSGKSTLLYLVGGLDKPTEGEVLINDIDIFSLSDEKMAKLRRSDIGFVFQFYNLVQNLTVEENIMLPVIMNGEKESNYKDRLEYILKTIGLYDKRKYLPRELSGGQQQRVSIARAIILKPSIIFADEPIGNLDSKSGIEVMELFKKINKEEKITILQVTHSEESAKYGNRIIRLKDGKIIDEK